MYQKVIEKFQKSKFNERDLLSKFLKSRNDLFKFSDQSSKRSSLLFVKWTKKSIQKCSLFGGYQVVAFDKSSVSFCQLIFVSILLN